MGAFLERYGIAIFVLVIIGIMVLMANGLGSEIKGKVSQEINKFTKSAVIENEKALQNQTSSDEIPDFSHLTTIEGCPLKFGQAYINTENGSYIGLLPFADGGALVGWPGFGWASDSVDYFPTGSLSYDGLNVLFDGMVIATCNEQGTEVYYDGTTFTLEPILLNTNDFCAHNITRTEAKHYAETYVLGETDKYTGDEYCVYCHELAKNGTCKHTYTTNVNKMGIGNGDEVCNDCDKVVKYDCVYYQYTGSNENIYEKIDSSVIGSSYKKYTASDGFPETVNVGDIFRYGDYEYCYKKEAQDNSDSSWWYWRTIEADGWGVSIKDRNIKYPDGKILGEINNKPIVTMKCAFFASNIVDASNIKIPNTVYNLNSCFEECDSLTTVNGLELPSSVKYISYMFADCTSLTNLNIENWNINNIKTMQNTFYQCPAQTPSWYTK